MPCGRWHVGFKTPEDELEEFLAAQPSWRQKILLDDDSLSKEEASAATRSSWIELAQVQEQYLKLLQRCPEKWREYRERRKRIAQMYVPPARPGRPRTPPMEEAEILAMEEQGLNPEQIAKRLGLTKETVRKRLKTAKKRMPPERP
jgi:DNA-binding NarL/FixJ family response regulator